MVEYLEVLAVFVEHANAQVGRRDEGVPCLQSLERQPLAERGTILIPNAAYDAMPIFTWRNDKLVNVALLAHSRITKLKDDADVVPVHFA